MSPSTRSDTRKLKLQERAECSRASKRKLDDEFAATLVGPLVKSKKVNLVKTQKRKITDRLLNTPKNRKKAKGVEELVDSDSDFQKAKFTTPKNSRTGIKLGIGKGKFTKLQKTMKKVEAKTKFQFRCTVPTYNEDKRPITDGVKEIISQTPFAKLFEAFVQGKVKADKSNNQLAMLAKTYNYEDDVFEIGKKKFNITLSDVSKILGLNIEGEYINEDNTRLSGYFLEVFGNVGEINKKDISEAIIRELLNELETLDELRVRDENLSRLLLLDMCIKFLFPNGKGTLHINKVRPFLDLNNLSSYAWAKEVALFLRGKLLSFKTRDCASKNTEGCAYIILYWVCMRTNVLPAIQGMEDEPHLIRRWDLKEMKNILQKMTVKEIFAKFKSEDMPEEENDERQSMVIEKLTQDVNEAKSEILLLKENAAAQDIMIAKLVKYIQRCIQKGTMNDDGEQDHTIFKEFSNDIGKESTHEKYVDEMGMGDMEHASASPNDVSELREFGSIASAPVSDVRLQSANNVTWSSENRKDFQAVERRDSPITGGSIASTPTAVPPLKSASNVSSLSENNKYVHSVERREVLINGSRQQWAIIISGAEGNVGSENTVEGSAAVNDREAEMDRLGLLALEEFESSSKKEAGILKEVTAGPSHDERSMPNPLRNDPLKHLCDIEPPSFNLLSDDELQTPLQTIIQPIRAETVLHLDELEAGSTGKSIGVYSYAKLPEKRVRKPKQDFIYYFPEVKSMRMRKNVDNLEDPKAANVPKRIRAKKQKIRDMLDAETRKRLSDFEKGAPAGGSFWNGSGNWVTDITFHEIDVLLSAEAITNIIIDAFSMLLSEEIKESDEVLAPRVEFLFTQAWLAAEKLDSPGMHQYIFEPLYKYMGRAQTILIPLSHKDSHFTLLIFYPARKTFLHMDSKPGTKGGTEEAYKDARKMVAIINLWMRAVEFQSEWMLENGTRDKFDFDRSSNTALVMKKDCPLFAEEIDTIKWVQKNYKSDFKLYPDLEPYPKQLPTSLECGVYVMHYMQSIACEEDPDIPKFKSTHATKFRVNLIKRFAAREDSWRAS